MSVKWPSRMDNTNQYLNTTKYSKPRVSIMDIYFTWKYILSFIQWSHIQNEIIYSFPNLYGCAVEVSEWISNSMLHFTGHAFTYPCWIHRGAVNSPPKWPVTRKMFPFDEVIMLWHLLSRIDGEIRRLCSWNEFNILSMNIVQTIPI